MKKQRRPMPDMSLSFLDIISCGLGAVLLLVLIARPGDPTAFESGEDLQGSLRDLQQQLFEVRGEASILNRELAHRQEQLSEHRERIARLQAQLASLERKHEAVAEADTTERDELSLALQMLTEEMQRLLSQRERTANDLVGGIPVDSEYLIFIIDTSGSMVNYVWPKVRQELVNILDIYPQVKGIQIMSDMGEYMFGNYRGQWIPDTPARRRVILQRLSTWTPFSNSSPVEGIEAAIRSFYDPQKKISLFVFGDDFTGRSIQEVVQVVDRLNRERRNGERLVRIHTVGFPVHFLVPGGNQQTATRFAALMRELSYRNGGTFVGLTNIR